MKSNNQRGILMTTRRSGSTPFEFIHRKDLHVLPGTVLDSEVNLHGGFAADKREGFGQLYYGMPGCGILRIDPDLGKQELIQLPETLKPLNFHSTKIGSINGSWRLFLPANDNALVAVVSLEGTLDFVLTKPEFEQYQAENIRFAPTDTLLVDQQLFVADGYGANYISSANVITRQWTGIFGGLAENATQNGKFSTAHGINIHPTHHQHLVIADRPNSRIQLHAAQGDFIASHPLPSGSWPCGIDFLNWGGRWLGVIGSLVDPQKDRPAPIYIVDATTFEVLSTIRPKEDLGIDPVQHLHNVVWHVNNDQLYLVCQSWNPGLYFVLECV
jgi:hypothetical protein